MMTSFGEGIKLTPLQLAATLPRSRMGERSIGFNTLAPRRKLRSLSLV